MRHMKQITRVKPANDEINTVLTVIGLLTAALTLYTRLAETFGFSIPQKGGDEE